jgi:heptosyltransferase-1
VNEDYKRILIVRPSAMGDILMASCLLSGLKHFYPRSQIDWVVEPRFFQVIEHHPALNRAIFWNKAEWSKQFKGLQLAALWKDTAALRHLLRFGPNNGAKGPYYDLVLDAQGLLRSRILSWLTGAQRRIGLTSREPGGFLMTELVNPPHDTFMASEYLYLLAHLTATDPHHLQKTISPAVHVSQTSTRAAKDLLTRHSIENYAVILPFTTRPQKHWIQQGWGQLAEGLHNLGYRTLLLGGPMDQEKAQAIAASFSQILNLTAAVPLSTALALIQGASLAIGVDTGLTHAAVIANIPTVAIFGSTRPYLSAWNARLRVIYHDLACAPCKRSPTCNGEFHCMNSISVQEVLSAALEVLQAGTWPLKSPK